MKIGKMQGFNTPESVEVITRWIDAHSPEERTHLYTVMGMTWNFLSEAVDRAAEFGGDSHEHLDPSD